MLARNYILDNQAQTVAEYLRRTLRDSDIFRVVSAYFTVYGYELLEDELNTVGEVRFLFGDPTSVDDLDPGEKAESLSSSRRMDWSRITYSRRNSWPSAVRGG